MSWFSWVPGSMMGCNGGREGGGRQKVGGRERERERERERVRDRERATPWINIDESISDIFYQCPTWGHWKQVIAELPENNLPIKVVLYCHGHLPLHRAVLSPGCGPHCDSNHSWNGRRGNRPSRESNWKPLLSGDRNVIPWSLSKVFAEEWLQGGVQVEGLSAQWWHYGKIQSDLRSGQGYKKRDLEGGGCMTTLCAWMHIRPWMHSSQATFKTNVIIHEATLARKPTTPQPLGSSDSTTCASAWLNPAPFYIAAETSKRPTEWLSWLMMSL